MKITLEGFPISEYQIEKIKNMSTEKLDNLYYDTYYGIRLFYGKHFRNPLFRDVEEGKKFPQTIIDKIMILTLNKKNE